MSRTDPWVSATVLLGMLMSCADAVPPEPAVPTPSETARKHPADVAPLLKPAITQLTDGLEPAHAQLQPILDRIELRDLGETQIRRVYPDGAVYLLVSDTRSGAAPSWSPFVTLTEQGVSQLQSVITAELIEKSPPPPSPGPGSHGGLIWVAYLDGQEQVVQTASGSYSSLPPFVQMLDDAVTQNVQPAQ